MEKIMGMFWWVKDRWEEPSTHAALAVVLQAVNAHIDVELINSLFDLMTIAFGAAAFWKKEAPAIGRQS